MFSIDAYLFDEHIASFFDNLIDATLNIHSNLRKKKKKKDLISTPPS